MEVALALICITFTAGGFASSRLVSKQYGAALLSVASLCWIGFGTYINATVATGVVNDTWRAISFALAIMCAGFAVMQVLSWLRQRRAERLVEGEREQAEYKQTLLKLGRLGQNRNRIRVRTRRL